MEKFSNVSNRLMSSINRKSFLSQAFAETQEEKAEYSQDEILVGTGGVYHINPATNEWIYEETGERHTEDTLIHPGFIRGDLKFPLPLRDENVIVNNDCNETGRYDYCNECQETFTLRVN